ncbi:MAG TPA: hypothetical protein ENG66_04975 [Thermococcus sp.]|uniref:hypothetical protein n=1 Tax=Thermococcus sp. TaxID=35749 RepID=UPI000BD8D3E5|nr:hypothetical protein [Thermococcus sp.]OYT32327.1 MAG: hypothetical protein B6U96_19715 [Archaeoglobales archaeon ex4484_92]RLF76859.1 MAG: hypothetical protein DRN51_01310 [Thermococci archaeon]MCD6144470.1 hypothetical protein [Thermococcus sp.]RLF82845.1 MAG: hypothetical protein DRN41_08380 [Thermococci archaeon]HDH44725.1 hypothetical protein [Thermococcus sp.]
MLFKKKGLFTVSDALKVVEMASKEDPREIIIMCEAIDEDAKRRLWDYAKGVELMADLTGEKRNVKIEILEGYVSDKVKGIEL